MLNKQLLDKLYYELHGKAHLETLLIKKEFKKQP